MAVGLISVVAGLVTMLTSSWTVLPAALVVALATWIWWNRSREGPKTSRPVPAGDGGARGGREQPEEGAGQTVDGAAVKADTERANVLEITETAELKVGVQPSPVALEPKGILDTMVKDQKETNFAPALSNQQDLPAVEQISNKIQTELITPTSGGESPVHNTHITEYNLGQEKRCVCEKIKPTLSIEEEIKKSFHKDEALDLVSAVNQKFDGTDSHIIQTNKEISESNADVALNLNAIETEMEKGKRKAIKLVFKDELERTAASSESENMAKKVAAVSPLPLNNVSVSFNVHYITCFNSHTLAVSGNHECLGQWENYVPLKPNKDGFWSNSILLPVNSRFEWKYVVVENGKIWRWEECPNRCLETSHEDMEMYQCWGYH